MKTDYHLPAGGFGGAVVGGGGVGGVGGAGGAVELQAAIFRM